MSRNGNKNQQQKLCKLQKPAIEITVDFFKWVLTYSVGSYVETI